MDVASLQDERVALQRSSGRARLAVRREHSGDRVKDLFQEGAAKIARPSIRPGDPLEAVLVNTGGGMTGGDRLSTEFDVGPGASLVVTTQASEKVYRARDGVALVRNRAALAPGASLEWLPQETILFDRAGLDRSFEAELAEGARLLAVEAIVFGRTAQGEVVARGFVRDAWRIRREGRLVFADALRLDGAIDESLAARAAAGGARAAATVVMVGDDAEARLDEARQVLEGFAAEGGASAWNGRLLVRFLAADGARLRHMLVALLGRLRGRALPRVWSC
jgi:urease accessory protein